MTTDTIPSMITNWPSSWYDWYAWQDPPKPPEVKPPRQPPRCWLCGRFTARPKYVMTRECAHCDVRWQELTAEAWAERIRAREKELTGILNRFSLADEGFIDHATVNSPAVA